MNLVSEREREKKKLFALLSRLCFCFLRCDGCALVLELGHRANEAITLV